MTKDLTCLSSYIALHLFICNPCLNNIEVPTDPSKCFRFFQKASFIGKLDIHYWPMISEVQKDSTSKYLTPCSSHAFFIGSWISTTGDSFLSFGNTYANYMVNSAIISYYVLVYLHLSDCFPLQKLALTNILRKWGF